MGVNMYLYMNIVLVFSVKVMKLSDVLIFLRSNCFQSYRFMRQPRNLFPKRKTV
jgi:hypothetical protein